MKALPRALTACALALGACARFEPAPPPEIHVEPVAARGISEVCVLFRRDSRRFTDNFERHGDQGFAGTFKAALRERGFAVRELPDEAGTDACRMVGTYDVRYQIYGKASNYGVYEMRIRIYVDGRQAGIADYVQDPHHASEKTDLFYALVDRLFPQPARAEGGRAS